MKKIGLLCMTALATLSLAACGNNASHKEKIRVNSSRKIVKHHKKHNKKSKKTSANSSSSSSSSSVSSNSQNSQQQKQQTQQSQSGGNQADPFDASTWDKPYKGYANFYAYMHDHPDTPNIQSQTAQMQHDENVKKGIENPDGSETDNFRKWEAARDWQEQQGNYNYPDYDQNKDWTTGLPY